MYGRWNYGIATIGDIHAMILFLKNNQWESCCMTLELWPTAWKILKCDMVNPKPCIGGINHWLNPKNYHFSLAFGLGLSANPPCPIFAIALCDSSFYTAPVLHAPLRHCERVDSLLLAVIRLLKTKPRVFLRHHCQPYHGLSVFFDLILSLLPSWKVPFSPASSFFSATREGFTLPLLIVVRLFMVAALLSTSPVSSGYSLVFPIHEIVYPFKWKRF